MTDLSYTSLPEWVRSAPSEQVDLPELRGRSYVLVAVTDNGRELAQSWREHLSGSPVDVVSGNTAEAVVEDLGHVLSRHHVGVRLWVAAPSGAALVVRAAALAAGLSDDEMTFVTTGSGRNLVYCAHCRARTETDAQAEGEVQCAGCGETLLVYYHVSRRTGDFLGFKVDAEAEFSPAPSTDPGNTAVSHERV